MANYDITDKDHIKANCFDIFYDSKLKLENEIFTHVSEDHIDDGQIVVTLIIQKR